MDYYLMRHMGRLALLFGALFAGAALWGDPEPCVPYIATGLVSFAATTHLLLARERR